MIWPALVFGVVWPSLAVGFAAGYGWAVWRRGAGQFDDPSLTGAEERTEAGWTP